MGPVQNVCQIPQAALFAINNPVSINEILSSHDLLDLFHLPLSPQALDKFHEFRQFVLRHNPNPTGADIWSYSWGPFSSASKIYNLSFDNVRAPAYSNCIWKFKCPSKIKAFIWFLLNDCLNTKDMLQRRYLRVDQIATHEISLQTAKTKYSLHPKFVMSFDNVKQLV
jgi:hypothetical protein